MQGTEKDLASRDITAAAHRDETPNPPTRCFLATSKRRNTRQWSTLLGAPLALTVLAGRAEKCEELAEESANKYVFFTGKASGARNAASACKSYST